MSKVQYIPYSNGKPIFRTRDNSYSFGPVFEGDQLRIVRAESRHLAQITLRHCETLSHFRRGYGEIREYRGDEYIDENMGK